jgi:hypothetical protein
MDISAALQKMLDAQGLDAWKRTPGKTSISCRSVVATAPGVIGSA